MQHVDGVGGAFVFSQDPKRLADWYSRHLGMQFDGSEEFGAFYQVFVALDPDDHARRLDTTFAIMRAKVPLARAPVESEPTDMYGDAPFMVNLRVRDLDALLAALADLLQRRATHQAEAPQGASAGARAAPHGVRGCDHRRRHCSPTG